MSPFKMVPIAVAACVVVLASLLPSAGTGRRNLGNPGSRHLVCLFPTAFRAGEPDERTHGHARKRGVLPERRRRHQHGHHRQPRR